MICQLFEVEIRDGLMDVYMDHAMSLRPALEQNGGCSYIERFQSLMRPAVLLSYQVWRDEGAMTAWRTQHHHHRVQETGREQVFVDYRIRVGQLALEISGATETVRSAAPASYNDPARRPPTWLVVANSASATPPLPPPDRHEAFASKYREESFAHLHDVTDRANAFALAQRLAAQPDVAVARVIEVYRDYGMYDRAEAPQYYPDVSRPE